MTYTKPEVTLLDAAVEAIQAQGGKAAQQGDSPFTAPVSAYESDE